MSGSSTLKISRWHVFVEAIVGEQIRRSDIAIDHEEIETISLLYLCYGFSIILIIANIIIMHQKRDLRQRVDDL